MKKTLYTLFYGFLFVALIFLILTMQVAGQDPKETPTPTPTETPPDPTPDPTPTPTSTPDPKDPCADCEWKTEVTWSCTNCREMPGPDPIVPCEMFDDGECFGCGFMSVNYCSPHECCEPFRFYTTLNCGWTVPDGVPYEEGFCTCALIEVGQGVEYFMCEGN